MNFRILRSSIINTKSLKALHDLCILEVYKVKLIVNAKSTKLEHRKMKEHEQQTSVNFNS